MSEANSGPDRVSREQRGHLWLVGLDRAAKRNAMDSALLMDLALALGEYEGNDELRCMVLFAHGEHFTAGLDLMELAPKLASGGLHYPEGSIDPWGTRLPRRSKPVVVAGRGHLLDRGHRIAAQRRYRHRCQQCALRSPGGAARHPAIRRLYCALHPGRRLGQRHALHAHWR